MELAFTAVFKKIPEGYIAFVEELPGANTQGATLMRVSYVRHHFEAPADL